jgi:hypothetical protein
MADFAHRTAKIRARAMNVEVEQRPIFTFFYERTEETNVIHHTLQVYLTMIVMLSEVSGNGCTVSVMRKNDSRARREPEGCLCTILAWVIADC